MSQPNVLRTVKIRSKENALYTKRYNRAHIDIPADQYQTDLSNSYFAFKLSLQSDAGEYLSNQDYKDLTQLGYEITFGHETFDYTPACLIKTAVLKRLKDGSIIESIPFSNIISQTMFQLTTSREQLASSNMLYANSLNLGSLSDFASISSSLIKDKMEVQIKLKDIFQSCSSPNFWLSETGGLSIQLEFEDRAKLFKLQATDARVGQVIPTEENANDSLLENYEERLDVNWNAAEASGRFPIAYGVDENTERQTQFRGITYDELTLLDPAVKPTTPDEFGGGLPPNSYINLRDTEADTEDIERLGLFSASPVRINWEVIPNPANRNLRKKFSMLNQIKSIIPYSEGTPAQPAVLQYNFTGAQLQAIQEWSDAPPSDAAKKAFYLSQGALPTDITSLTVNIDGTNGTYSISAEGWATDVAWANQKYIIPQRYLQTPTAPIIGSGQTNPHDLEILITAASNAGTTPTYSVSGNANPVPAAVPEVSAVHAKIEMQYPWYFDGLEENVIFKNIELFPGHMAEIPRNKIETLFDNKITVPKQLDEILAPAIAQASHGDYYFDMFIQPVYPIGENDINAMVTAKEITLIAPDYVEGEALLSNQATRVPNTGRRARFVSRTVNEDETATYLFEDLQMLLGVGPQFESVWRPAVSQPYSYNSVQPQNFVVSFEDVNVTTSIEAQIYEKIESMSYSLDQFEVVLQQETKNMKMPMAKAFSTFKIEPFTIQDSVYAFEKQFSVMEQNCYNIALLSPAEGSLISTNPNVFSYRFQINNIGNTTFDVQARTATSDYPSSVHLDKMLDYFNNSPFKLANFFGVKGLENTSKPVQMLPLKVYSSNDGEKYYTNTRNYSIQLLLSGNQPVNKTINKGSYYLIKSCISMI